MRSWIAVWLFVFAAAMFVAIVLNPEERRKNLPLLLVMLGVMGTTAWIFFNR